MITPDLQALPVRDGIFVPAIMSAGLVFSIITIVRDVVHDRRRSSHRRRITITAQTLAAQTISGGSTSTAVAQARRPRLFYLALAISASAVAIFIGIGAIVNFSRLDGFLSDIGWILATSLLVAIGFAVLAMVAFVLVIERPVPAWVAPLLVSTPLGHAPRPDSERSHRRWLLGWGAAVSGLCFVLLSVLAAASPTSFRGVDGAIRRVVSDIPRLDDLEFANWLGSTEAALGLALLVGVATLRCLPFAVVYVVSVAGTLGIDVLVKALVERDRPPGTVLSALEDSYPSGHLAQVVLITGFVPLAIEVLTDRKWHIHTTGLVLAGAVVVAGIVRIEDGLHWPTDIAGGVLLGAVVVTFGHWLLESPTWHRRCHACPWVPHQRQSRGAVHIPHGVVERLRRLALGWSAIVIIGYATFFAVWGIPRNPDNDLLGRNVEVPMSLAALGLLVVAWALALHWNGVGAVGLVGGGAVLAVLSSLANHPIVSLGIVGVFLVPALGLWLCWQHDQSRRALVVLAGVTVSLVIGVYAASASVNNHFFGPTHPQSETASIPIDLAEWIVAGAVTSEGFRVHALLDDDVERTTRMVVRASDGQTVAKTPERSIPESRIVTYEVTGLDAGTTYHYLIEGDGAVDQGRGRGQIRTFPRGAADLRVVVSSCARSGTNGQVFDAIRRLDPDLYLVTGDLHYGNPANMDPDLFRRHFRRVLTASAPAALFRSTAFAYVWDDHDFGPNDADGSSPTRDTARAVYREVVPNTAAPSGTINQSFTAGRVRFVLTDTRSAKSDSTMLGRPQIDWLLDELRTASKSHGLVVWANSVPWIAPTDPSRDDWGAYPDERDEILDVIRRERIENLVMVSGDAHMVAIDDGTNSGGFPVLHSAALDRPGTVKGGPYSEGAFPGSGQFGVVDVHDAGGDEITVTLSGRTWDDRELVSHRFTVRVPANPSS